MNQKDRMSYLVDVREMIIDFIYKHHERQKKSKLNHLIVSNHMLLGRNDVSVTFMFNGELYYINTKPHPSDTKINKAIHPDLLDDVRKLLQPDDFNAEIQRHQISGLLCNLLTETNNIDDLYSLLPTPIHEIIKRINWKYFDTSNIPLSKETIERIKKDNILGFNTLHELLMTKLLLPTK